MFFLTEGYKDTKIGKLFGTLLLGGFKDALNIFTEKIFYGNDVLHSSRYPFDGLKKDKSNKNNFVYLEIFVNYDDVDLKKYMDEIEKLVKFPKLLVLLVEKENNTQQDKPTFLLIDDELELQNKKYKLNCYLQKDYIKEIYFSSKEKFTEEDVESGIIFLEKKAKHSTRNTRVIVYEMVELL